LAPCLPAKKPPRKGRDCSCKWHLAPLLLNHGGIVPLCSVWRIALLWRKGGFRGSIGFGYPPFAENVWFSAAPSPFLLGTTNIFQGISKNFGASPTFFFFVVFSPQNLFSTQNSNTHSSPTPEPSWTTLGKVYRSSCLFLKPPHFFAQNRCERQIFLLATADRLFYRAAGVFWFPPRCCALGAVDLSQNSPTSF